MRPNSQALKHKSSHDTEREFGGTLGESQQSRPPYSGAITIHPLSFHLRRFGLYITVNPTLRSKMRYHICCSEAENTQTFSCTLVTCRMLNYIFVTPCCSQVKAACPYKPLYIGGETQLKHVRELHVFLSEQAEADFMKGRSKRR